MHSLTLVIYYRENVPSVKEIFPFPASPEAVLSNKSKKIKSQNEKKSALCESNNNVYDFPGVLSCCYRRVQRSTSERGSRGSHRCT